MNLSYEQTKNFPLNSSPSKYQYLFPKTKRFQLEKIQKGKRKFYTIPSSITTNGEKASSFPKLPRKLQFANEKEKKMVPSPSTYSLKSDIERSVESKKGISMAQSRRRQTTSFFSPGPSVYYPKVEPFPTQRFIIGKSSKKFQFPIQLRKGNSSPGPAYLINLSKLEKVVGKFVEKKCMKVYSQPSLKRINRTKSQNPQKNHVIRQSSFSKKQSQNNLGLYSNKKMSNTSISYDRSAQKQKKSPSIILVKNTPSILGKFGKEDRKSIFQQKKTTPGPSYNWFSEFSRLEKKIYTQKLNNQKPNKILKI